MPTAWYVCALAAAARGPGELHARGEVCARRAVGAEVLRPARHALGLLTYPFQMIKNQIFPLSSSEHFELRDGPFLPNRYVIFNIV